jgi:hypothetical protein
VLGAGAPAAGLFRSCDLRLRRPHAERPPSEGCVVVKPYAGKTSVDLQTRVTLAGLSIFYKLLHRDPAILYRKRERSNRVRDTNPGGTAESSLTCKEDRP